jgi:hypothetical protein
MIGSGMPGRPQRSEGALAVGEGSGYFDDSSQT